MSLVSNQPLSKNELRKLYKILSSNCEDDKPTNLSQVHGFFTAIVSAPNIIMPSQWLPVIFGDNPETKSKEEIMDMINLLGRLHNSIGDVLKNSDEFEPQLFEADTLIPFKEAPIELASEWCYGYIQGVDLDELWSNDPDGIDSLLPFAVLANEFSLIGCPTLDGGTIQDDIPEKKKVLENLPGYVKKIHDFWLNYRKTNLMGKTGTSGIHVNLDIDVPYEREGKKIGRNESCLCGSGKKYKKCCIATNQSIH